MTTFWKMNMTQAMVAQNPHQGNAKRVLCVCSAGLLRSPTAANVLHKKHGLNTRSCGLETEFALIPITENLIHWADEIVCMTEDQVPRLRDLCKQGNLVGDPPPIVCLGIPDEFVYMEERLQKLIEERY